MAIVIVGVGDANFGAYKTQFGDKALLRSKNGKKAEADIVQFVQFN